MKSNRLTRLFAKNAFIYSQNIILIIFALIMMLPIMWIFLAAFKQQVDLYQLKVFFTPTFENFTKIFDKPYQIGDKLVNSTFVAFVTVLIAIPIATIAAYSFSRFKMKGAVIIYVFILSTQFIPAVLIILPYFVAFRTLGLLDTKIGLILVNLSFVIPFAIWMIKGFIDGIPVDTEEAAMVDGASRLRVIRDVVLPMAAPGILTAGIFCFIMTWNDFIYALILTSRKAVTLPIGLALFNSETGQLWNYMSAAGIIIMAPIFILSLMIKKHFVQGVTMGAVR